MDFKIKPNNRLIVNQLTKLLKIISKLLRIH